MQASQLIRLLAEAIEKYGDLPVKSAFDWYGHGIKITTISNTPVLIDDPTDTTIIFINLE